MLTLALDCSTARGSVALVGGQDTELLQTLWEATFTAGRGHGGELFTTLERAMARIRESGEPLAQVVVGLGPGSYSGVRQAIAAAVGLSVATRSALHGVPSPVALETDAVSFHAVGDARRGAFYHTAVENGQPLAPGPVLLPDRAALDARLAQNPAWPVLAVETADDLLPPAAQPALPLARAATTFAPGGLDPAPRWSRSTCAPSRLPCPRLVLDDSTLPRYAQRMTWDEVCADPVLQDLPYKIELNKWGNIEMSPARNRHGEFQIKIGQLLGLLKPEGVTVAECAIETSENVKVPDVAWTSFERYDAAAIPDEVYTDTAPEICVEIILPSNSVEEQMYKGQLYLQAGAEEFWLCNELGDVRFFDASGPLEHSKLCPDFPTRIEFRR